MTRVTVIGAAVGGSRTRLAAARFVVLTLVAEVLKGDSSSPTGSADEIAAFFAPDGGYGFLLLWFLPIWVAVTAVRATANVEPISPELRLAAA